MLQLILSRRSEPLLSGAEGSISKHERHNVIIIKIFELGSKNTLKQCGSYAIHSVSGIPDCTLNTKPAPELRVQHNFVIAMILSP
jgi:hypothetical protein